MSGEPSDTQWQLLHQIATSQRGIDVWLCQNQRDQSLAVAKIWLPASLGTGEARKLGTLLRVPDYPQVVQVQQIFEDWPSTEHLTAIMAFYNGGTIAQLGDIAESRGEWIPEELIWYFIDQVLEGLRVYADHQIAHRNLHGGNILLHITDEGLLEVRIADPWPADHAFRLDEDMQFDLWSFSGSLWRLMTTQTYKEAPYSEALVRWTRYLRFVQSSETAKWVTAIEELHPIAQNMGESIELPDWILEYFSERHKNIQDTSWFERYRQNLENSRRREEPEDNRVDWNGEDPPLQPDELIRWAEDRFLNLPDRTYDLIFRDGGPTGPLIDAKKLSWIIARMRRRLTSIFEQYMQTRERKEFEDFLQLFSLICDCSNVSNQLVLDGVVEDLHSATFTRGGLIDELRDLDLIRNEADEWVIRSILRDHRNPFV